MRQAGTLLAFRLLQADVPDIASISSISLSGVELADAGRQLQLACSLVSQPSQKCRCQDISANPAKSRLSLQTCGLHTPTIRGVRPVSREFGPPAERPVNRQGAREPSQDDDR